MINMLFYCHRHYDHGSHQHLLHYYCGRYSAYLGNKADVDPSRLILPHALDVQLQKLVLWRVVGKNQDHRPLKQQAQLVQDSGLIYLLI